VASAIGVSKTVVPDSARLVDDVRQPPVRPECGGPRGAVTVAALDKWVAVRRVWHESRYISPSESARKATNSVAGRDLT
jgi:hypothetical protein